MTPTHPPAPVTVLPDAFPSTLQRALAERSPTPDLSVAFPGYRRAAVLVPVLQASGGLELLFTVRSAGLPHHAGQISFPGGRLEPGESLADAARRETFEEVGLAVPETALLGTLHDLPSPARYLVTPVVGLVGWPQPLALSAAEVDEVFSVPVAELLTLTPKQEVRLLAGQQRVSYSYAHRSLERERLIWGLTGTVVADLLSVLRPLL